MPYVFVTNICSESFYDGHLYKLRAYSVDSLCWIVNVFAFYKTLVIYYYVCTSVLEDLCVVSVSVCVSVSMRAYA